MRIFPGEPGEADRIGGALLLVSLMWMVFGGEQREWMAGSLAAWAFIIGDVVRRVWQHRKTSA